LGGEEFTLLQIELLLFDLGGVLLEFTGPRELGRMLREPLSEPEIRARWIVCPHIRAFEIGALSPGEFASQFMAAWGVRVPEDEFLRAFESWNARLYPGSSELLAELRPRFRLAALSNSNELHWRTNERVLQIPALFEKALSSHELGYHKPDVRIYARALEELRVQPEAVAFFDDNLPNVEAAASFGMAAHHVQGVAETRKCLVGVGLL
jgi:HAD superfamily hydrolase (TIGR01509 family)